MNDLRQRLEEALDLDPILGLLRDLVAIDTSGGAEGEAQTVMEQAMKEAGLKIESWDIDLQELSRHPACRPEIDRKEARGLVGTRRGSGGGRSLALNSHIDVVPTGDPARWTDHPLRLTIREDRAYGRGALDAKGQLACGLGAITTLERAGIELAGDLSLQSVVGEEDGGVGALATVLRLKELARSDRRALPDAAIVLEPTGLRMATAQAGCLDFEIEIHGRAAHGCLRHEGVSALEKFLPIHQALLDLERRMNSGPHPEPFDQVPHPWPLSIGTVSAGDWPSSVPEALHCAGRFGVPVDTDPAVCREQFEAAVREAAAADEWLQQNQPQIHWTSRFEPARCPADAPVAQVFAKVLEDQGRSPAAIGTTFGADMRLLVHEGGIPTLMFGPGDIRLAHRTDESVALAELREAILILALVAVQFCGPTA